MRFLLPFSGLLLFIAAIGASAQDEKLVELHGTIRDLDLNTGVVTLMPQSGQATRVLNLSSKDLSITNPLGQQFKLNDLRAEFRITALLRNDDEIAAIRIDGPYQYGAIVSVDAAKRSLVLKDVFAEKTVMVPADAKIVFNGKPASLANFRRADPVRLLYSLDRKTILHVQAGKGISIREPYHRLALAVGIIADLDKAKRRVQIFTQSYDIGLIKSYELSKDVYLRQTYQTKPLAEITLDQLSKWVKVTYYVDRETEKIANINAELPFLSRRRVVSVDAAKYTVMVDDDGIEKTLHLAPAVTVLTARGVGKLADIAAGRQIQCGLTLDRSQVLVVTLLDN